MIDRDAERMMPDQSCVVPVRTVRGSTPIGPFLNGLASTEFILELTDAVADQIASERAVLDDAARALDVGDTHTASEALVLLKAIARPCASPRWVMQAGVVR